MHLFSPNHPVGRALGFLFDAFCVSIVWAVLSLPIVTLGATSSALYRVALNWVREKEQCNVSAFWSAFKENFRKGTLIWLILLPILLLILLNGYLIWFSAVQMPWIAKWSFFVAGFLWSAIAVHVFALQALFENKVLRTIYNALRIALAKLPLTLIMLVIFGVAGFLSFLLPIAAVLLFPWAVFLNAYLNWRILKQLAPQS